MSVRTAKSPGKGMTGRKQKLAGAIVRTVVKESVEAERRRKRKGNYMKHKTPGGHMQARPSRGVTYRIRHSRKLLEIAPLFAMLQVTLSPSAENLDDWDLLLERVLSTEYSVLRTNHAHRFCCG